MLLILHRASRPIGAYALKKALEASLSRTVFPTSIYRALESLMGAGLVTRIASRNAYRTRDNPRDGSASLYYVCGSCGSTAEVTDPVVDRQLDRDAGDLGFLVERRVVEVEGTCRLCVSAGGQLSTAR